MIRKYIQKLVSRSLFTRNPILLDESINFKIKILLIFNMCLFMIISYYFSQKCYADYST